MASAAYRAGEKLHSEYYGEVSDYTRKGGVICSEILLPSHAPPEYADRETLWNAVEKAERGKKAQLAYSFDIALQNEFSMQENIALARQFLLENFVSRGYGGGLCRSFCPTSEDGGISNPHFHVMCPIRPIEPSTAGGATNSGGNMCWTSMESASGTRQATMYSTLCPPPIGAALKPWSIGGRHGLICATRSLRRKIWIAGSTTAAMTRQGIEQIPTVHEGPSVRAMEAKGIRTDKGDFNRWVRKTNAMLREAKNKIASLLKWLKAVKEELSKPQPPMLNDLLMTYYNNRNKGAYSTKAKTANLQRYADAFRFLQEKQLFTTDDLDAALHSMQNSISAMKASAGEKQSRIKELDELLRMAQYYVDGKPVADKLGSIRFEKSRQKYKSEHDDTLRTFYMAERKLKPYFKDGKIPITAWRRERERLEQEYKDIQTELSPLYADVKKLWAIHYNIYEVQHEQERQQTQLRSRKNEIEL